MSNVSEYLKNNFKQRLEDSFRRMNSTERYLFWCIHNNERSNAVIEKRLLVTAKIASVELFNMDTEESPSRIKLVFYLYYDLDNTSKLDNNSKYITKIDIQYGIEEFTIDQLGSTFSSRNLDVLIKVAIDSEYNRKISNVRSFIDTNFGGYKMWDNKCKMNILGLR